MGGGLGILAPAFGESVTPCSVADASFRLGGQESCWPVGWMPRTRYKISRTSGYIQYIHFYLLKVKKQQ